MALERSRMLAKHASSLWPASFAVALSSLIIGCGGSTHFEIKYAPEYAPPTAPFSVFGVYENGRLNAEAWREISAVLSRNFGSSSCESAWNYQFQTANPTLSAAVDEYTKDNGVSDELLDKLAPMAKGGAILSFTVYRNQGMAEPDAPKSSRPPASSARTAGMSRRMVGAPMGGLRATGWARPTLADAESRNASEPVYEISALLFSLKDRRSIVLVSMSHRGAELDEALDKFSARLREAIPQVSCAGWNLEAPINVANIQALHAQQAPETAIEAEPSSE